MTNPVPGYSVSSAYHKSGSHWTTCGWHTGQDYAAPAGQAIVAARGGTVAYVDYGSAFGGHQFAIRPGDGTEDFYAHCRSRPPSGVQVATGEPVATVGSEGNSTGPHLHLERHKSFGWGCSLMDDPMKSHNHQGGTAPAPSEEDEDMFIAESPGRGSGLFGPGYFKVLNQEESDVMRDLGVRHVSYNDRAFDVARVACLDGETAN